LVPWTVLLLSGVAFLARAAGQTTGDTKAPTALSSAGEEATRFRPKPVLMPEVNSAVLALAYAPDGKRIALAFDDQTVQLRVLPEGEVRHTLKGHAEAVTCLAFAPDGKALATAGTDKLVKLWDPATGQERLTLFGHTNWVYALAFSPDGKTLASAGYDKTVRL